MARLNPTSANTMLGSVFTGTQYLALFTTDPSTTGSGSEVTGGSYARQSITWATASGGSQSSSNAQNFTGMPVEASGVPYFGIYSASTGGTYLGGGTVSGVASVPAGATVAFASGAVTLSLS